MSKSLHGGVRSHALDLSSLPISRFVGSLRDSPHPLNAQLGAMSENDLDAASAFVADESLNVVLGQARSLIQLLSAQVASEKNNGLRSRRLGGRARPSRRTSGAVLCRGAGRRGCALSAGG